MTDPEDDPPLPPLKSEDDDPDWLLRLSPELFDDNGRFKLLQFGDGDKRTAADHQVRREIANEAREADAAKAKAEAFAHALLGSLTPAERVQHAAPFAGTKPPHRDRKYDWHFPVWDPVRHDLWAEASSVSLAERARQKGLNVTSASFLRAEVILLMLRRGEAPPFSVFDARRAAFEEANRWASATYLILDAAHEMDLKAAIEGGLVRQDDDGELRAPAASVLIRLWHDLSILKVVGGRLQLRAMLRSLRCAYDLFKEEHPR